MHKPRSSTLVHSSLPRRETSAIGLGRSHSAKLRPPPPARNFRLAREKEASDWVLATLGRLPAEKVRTFLKRDPLLGRLAPMLLLSDPSNWIADDAVDIDLKFLLKQNLY